MIFLKAFSVRKLGELYFCFQFSANSCNGTMCHINATCVNSTEDGVHCECNIGFDGDGINCTSKYV